MQVKKGGNMKTNLKKLKDGLFASFIIIMAIVIVGALAIRVKNNDEDFSSIVMAGAEEINFKNPLENCEVIKDFSAEKLQFNSTLKQWEAHKAIDLKAEMGDSVFAIAGGKVKSIETTHLFGTTVVIEHSGGFVSKYSSLSKEVSVAVGDSVKAGQKIGTVDNSAKGEIEQGLHLHFELLKDNKKIDPNLYFTFGQK